MCYLFSVLKLFYIILKNMSTNESKFRFSCHIWPGADTGFKRGGQDFLGTKKFIIRNKKSRRRLKRLKKSQN